MAHSLIPLVFQVSCHTLLCSPSCCRPTLKCPHMRGAFDWSCDSTGVELGCEPACERYRHYCSDTSAASYGRKAPWGPLVTIINKPSMQLSLLCPVMDRHCVHGCTHLDEHQIHNQTTPASIPQLHKHLEQLMCLLGCQLCTQMGWDAMGWVCDACLQVAWVAVASRTGCV